MRTHWLILIFLCGIICISDAQTAMLQKQISFNYENISLEKALEDIREKYKVNFSYSRNFIPINQKVSAKVVEVSLKKALIILFERLPVDFAIIGDQVVLRVDYSKPIPELIPEETYGNTDLTKAIDSAPTELSADTDPLGGLIVDNLPNLPSQEEIDLEEQARLEEEQTFDLVEFDSELTDEKVKRRREKVGQVSLISGLGTNLDNSDLITNNFSLNILWGENGGLEGIEIGGFVNKLKQDMDGVQVAGLGNVVDGLVDGTQVAGLFNYAGAYATGVQAAGLFNYARSGHFTQVAGLANATSGDVRGAQIAGLANMAYGDAEAVQLAGLYNFAAGNSQLQVGGLFNVAEDVDEGQLSGILNVAHNVGKFQIGLINICDTISGVPLGLINIVRKGYNRWEWSGGEALYFNSGFKFGAQRFYNILHFGMRTENGDPIGNRDNKITWGLGYGIGTAVRAGPRTLVNFEALSIHVNERQTFTRKLNLLNQFKITADFQLGQSNSSFFIGPSLNVMLSKLFDPDTQRYGSAIAPYTFYDETSNENTNIQMWIGANVGFRF